MQLHDACVADAVHPDLGRPILGRHGLDDVVAIDGLHRFEGIEGTTAAAGATHIHLNQRIAERRRDEPGRVVAVRARRGVSRILDQRREGAVFDRARKGYERRQLRPVPGPEIVVAGREGRTVVRPRPVDRLVYLTICGNRDRAGLRSTLSLVVKGIDTDVARGKVSDQHAAVLVNLDLGETFSRLVDDVQASAGLHIGGHGVDRQLEGPGP